MRRLLVRLHPTIGKEALAVLRVAAAVTVQRPLDFAGVRPLERELLTFEITGRRATEVVKAVLKPVLKTGDETKEVSRIWARRDCETLTITCAGMEEAQFCGGARERTLGHGHRAGGLRSSTEVRCAASLSLSISLPSLTVLVTLQLPAQARQVGPSYRRHRPARPFARHRRSHALLGSKGARGTPQTAVHQIRD